MKPVFKLNLDKMIARTGFLHYYQEYVIIKIKSDEENKKYTKENCLFDVRVGEESFYDINSIDLIEFLREITKMVTEDRKGKKSEPKIIIFVNNLLLFNFFFKDDYYVKGVTGSDSGIMTIDTDCISFVDLECAAGGSQKEDFGFVDDDWLNVFQYYIEENCKSVKLNQIRYSPAYINDKYFRANYKEAVEEMKAISNQPINYSHGNLLKMMCRNSAILHCDNRAAKLYFEDIYAPDVTSLYPMCLLITKMPFGPAKEVNLKDKENHLELIKDLIDKNFCFDCEIRFKEKPIKKINSMPELQIIKLEKDNEIQYVFPLNEISFKYLEKQYIVNWEEAVVTRLFYYKEKGYLPKSYCDAIVDLFYKKETLKKGSREQLNAKLAINGQIGKGAQDYLYLEGYEVENGKIIKKENKKIDESSWNFEAINKVFKNRYLCPQWSVRVYSKARSYVASAAERLSAVGAYNLYTDTDCHFFKAINNNINYEELFEELYKPIRKFLISRYGDRISIKKENGKIKELGAWDFTYYKKFKYFKLKCYIGIKDNGDIKITMGGCRKEASESYIKTIKKDLKDLMIEDLNIGEEFKPNKRAIYDTDNCTYEWSWTSYNVVIEGIDKILSERFKEET